MQAYNEAGDDRDFEIVLIGHDENDAAMLEYMSDSKMPFSGVKKSEETGLKNFNDLGNNGLPFMALFNTNGERVSTDSAEIMAKLN